MIESSIKSLDLLALSRCPHCNVAHPHLARVYGPVSSISVNGQISRWWNLYKCDSCGGMVIAASEHKEGKVNEMYPKAVVVNESIPEPANTYLNQAIESLHAPAGAVMLSASAVDSMLKIKGFKVGSLKQRIDEAATNHLITSEMAAWVHEVRLDANEQRHADENVSLPNDVDAKKSVSFALALAEFLFVLPARVERERKPQSQK